MREASASRIVVHVNVVPEKRRDRVPEPLIRRGVLLAVGEEGVGEGELSISFVDDATIRRLNRTHLGHDRPTDVLAFTLSSEGGSLLGDVYVGLDQAIRQAGELQVSLDEELVRLAVHGTLHVLGYDHPEGKGREESAHFHRQEAVVRRALE